MGWIFNTTKQTKSQFIQEILTSTISKDYEVLKSSLKNDHMWVLIQNKNSKESYIYLYLLSSEDGCWGYKSISEDAGPLYFDCPKKLLKLQPNIRTNASNLWRKQNITKI